MVKSGSGRKREASMLEMKAAAGAARERGEVSCCGSYLGLNVGHDNRVVACRLPCRGDRSMRQVGIGLLWCYCARKGEGGRYECMTSSSAWVGEATRTGGGRILGCAGAPAIPEGGGEAGGSTTRCFASGERRAGAGSSRRAEMEEKKMHPSTMDRPPLTSLIAAWYHM